MRAPLPIVFALLASLLAPLPALAALVMAPEPPASAVQSGELVTTAIPDLPAGAYEFELVLLPEHGPAIQVSAERPAGVHEVTWRMPRLYASRARLLVRVGGERSEVSLTPSRWFALAPPRASDLAQLVTDAGGDHPAAASRHCARAALDGPEPAAEFGASTALPAAVPAPTPPGVAVAFGGRPRLIDCGAPRIARCTSGPEFAGPTRTPLRN